jgi:hypothetical protein
MATGKYAKNIQKLNPTGITHPEYGKKMREPILLDKRAIPQVPFIAILQYPFESGCGWGLGNKLVGPPPFDHVEDLPHSHDQDEYWIFVGTDPKNNKDLGGEVEFWMGEGDEAEKYVITEPSVVYVPAGVVHLPIVFKNIKRPFFSIPILVADSYESKYTPIPAAFKK